MILILTQGGSEPVAQAIAAVLSQEYSFARPPEVVAADAVWAGNLEWDDLLLVVYNAAALPASALQYIDAWQTAHKTGGAVIPVGANAAFPIPPDPLSGIKAAKYDGSPQRTAAIVTAVGVFLGLALRPGSQKIFVSYRASDGKQLAQCVYDRLTAAGFKPWLDEAMENLAIGDEVQDKIRKNLEEAAIVLLVDTPNAPDSRWVAIEVDMANAQLVPVLPMVIGPDRLSRFIQLQGLRRWALVKTDGLDGAPLSDAEWDGVQAEINQLLLSTFRRRLKILERAKAAFTANQYDWQTIDERLRMYRADRATRFGSIVALTHCLVQDITYVPALKAYWNYLRSYGDLAAVNQKLCIYDRDKVLSPPEMKTLLANLPGMNAILAHYNELDMLVTQNFAG